MVEVEPIPWRFQGESSGVRVWRWQTPHFSATVIGEGNSFQWDLGDLSVSSDGTPIPLADGLSSDFVSCESAIREIVGKSYLPSLGYGRYAGRLATTFAIATGERIDFGQFEGSAVIVVVGLGGGRTTTIAGQASVQHYELVVAQPGSDTVKIQPHRVRSIIFERGGYDQMRSNHTGVSRMYRGQVSRACTGHPGFMDGTVEHSGKKCPVHEYDTIG